jgi:hypothetical protein
MVVVLSGAVGVKVKGVCQVDGTGVVIVHLSGVVEMGEVI